MFGEIKKFLRDDGIIKISRNTKELGFKIKELSRIYLSKTGECISIRKIISNIGITRRDYIFSNGSR